MIKLGSATKLPTTCANPHNKCSDTGFFNGEEEYRLVLAWKEERNEAIESMELLGLGCRNVSILERGVGESSSTGILFSSSWSSKSGRGGSLRPTVVVVVEGGGGAGWLLVKKAKVEEANEDIVRGWEVDRVCCCDALEKGIGVEIEDFTGLFTDDMMGFVKVIVHDNVSPA